eukprot:7645425-Pyramimonas_sp.AAC.1
MAGAEGAADGGVKRGEDTVGNCDLNNFTCRDCAASCTKDGDGNATLDQDECTTQRRLIQQIELTGADAEARASKMVVDMFASLRGALAYAVITQARCMVYVASLQRAQ